MNVTALFSKSLLKKVRTQTNSDIFTCPPCKPSCQEGRMSGNCVS